MLAMPAGGKMMRENVATTSAELNGVPSWNFTPSRSLKVYVLPSDEIFQLSARSGMIVLSPSAGLKRTRLLYICPRTKRNAPWCTSKCATSAGPAHLSTPPRLGFGSAARARSACTAALAGAGRFSDHAVSAVVAAAVLRNRLRFTLPSRRGWSMSRALLWVGARLPYARDHAVVNRGGRPGTSAWLFVLQHERAVAATARGALHSAPRSFGVMFSADRTSVAAQRSEE